MNPNLRQQLKSLMEADGLTDQQQLRYVLLFTQCENDNFINGRRFEIDGKGSPLPVFSAVPDNQLDLFRSQEIEWMRDYTQEEQDNIERWSE